MTQTQRVAQMRAEGLDTNEIAAQLGVKPCTVICHDSLARLKAGLTRQQTWKARHPRVLEMLANGTSAKEVSRRTGVPLSTVFRLRLRARRAQGTTRPWVSEADEAPMDARRRVAHQVAAGERCRRCHSPIGGLCTAEKCELDGAFAPLARARHEWDPVRGKWKARAQKPRRRKP